MLEVLFTITDKVESNAVPSLQNGRITHNWHWDTQVRGLLLYPPRERAFCIHKTKRFLPWARRNNDHHPTKPPTQALVNPSTKPPSTDHILPAEPDKTWPGGSFYTQCSRFRKTHTCWHIFPHRMCLNFIFCVPVVIFHCIGDGAKSFNMFLKNIFLYDNSSV